MKLYQIAFTEYSVLVENISTIMLFIFEYLGRIVFRDENVYRIYGHLDTHFVIWHLA